MAIIEYTYTISEIDALASSLLKKVTAKTILFYGEMGVGKTTLIKALSKQLGSVAPGHSPTFSIVNEYELNKDLIYHFDLYRIQNEEEALQFGIEEYLFSEHWLFIEWPEKLGNLLPDNFNTIKIILNSDGSRTLELHTTNNLADKIAQEH